MLNVYRLLQKIHRIFTIGKMLAIISKSFCIDIPLLSCFGDTQWLLGAFKPV